MGYNTSGIPYIITPPVDERKALLMLVNTGSDNGLVPLGNKPLPKPIIDKIAWRHMESPGDNEWAMCLGSKIRKTEATPDVSAWLSQLFFFANTLRPRQNICHFADDIFKCIFLNENVWILIKISLKFVSNGPINNTSALVQIMAWYRPGDKPLSEPMLVSFLTHICVTRSQWVNTIMMFICISGQGHADYR